MWVASSACMEGIETSMSNRRMPYPRLQSCSQELAMHGLLITNIRVLNRSQL